MKNFYSSLLFLLSWTFVSAQVTIFSDDFDSGLSSWSLTGQWGTTSTQAFNGTYSLADSPSGLYQNNQTTYASINSAFDLQTSLDANIYFKAKYDIENGFDYCYVDVSANNGTSWTAAYTINGEGYLSSWTDFNINIGGFVGNSQVKVRFRLYTDAGYQSDGIFIDSLRITKDSVDNAPPLIIHEPDIHYEGTIGTNSRVVTITDISGVASAVMYYSVDGGSYVSLNPSDTNGDDYTYDIPAQDAGAFVDYYVEAIDSSAQANSALSQVYNYVHGNYIKYETGVVSFITSYVSSGTYNGTAMRMTLDGMTTITTAFIGNYTDVNNPNDSMLFHVWSNNNGNPGTDLIDPIMVFPAANLSQPHLITRIDLRPYSDDLDSLIGDVFIGFTVPSGTVWVGQTTPGTSNRVKNYNGSSWSAETDDYHFRIVTDEMILPPVADFEYDLTGDPTVVFSDSSLNNPTSWYWTFGDSFDDTIQHPTHTYASPSAYTVCLQVANAAGDDQVCKSFFTTNGPPNAFFSYSQTTDPTINFTDLTTQNPTSWSWDFGDSQVSTLQNPSHYYQDTGDFEVCLIASNAFGADTFCQTIHIYNRAPDAYFTYNVIASNHFTTFTDLSAFNPTSWHWDFDHNGDTSIVQNASYIYPLSGGTFNVCLIASNQYGESAPYCEEIEIEDLTIGMDELAAKGISISPNPTYGEINIQLPSNFQSVSMSVYTLTGKIVMTGKQNATGILSFNLEGQPAGIYFIELTENETVLGKAPVVVIE